MVLFIAITWLVLSIIAICIDQYRWDGLYKFFIGASILSFFLFGRYIYDPSAPISYAVTIELNDTWSAALLVSFVGGVCITGPFAAIHAFLDWLYYDRHININPFQKTSDYMKESRKRLIDKEKNARQIRRRKDSSKVNAKKLCRIADVLEIKQISFEEGNGNRNHITGTFSITNHGQMPVTDVAISKNLDQGKPGMQCTMYISIKDMIINPGETIEANGTNDFRCRSNNLRDESEYVYRIVGDDNDCIYKVNTAKREAYIINPEQPS